MTIDARCKEQLALAEQMYKQFKYTEPGSAEQLRSLGTLTFLISMWADFFLRTEAKRMDAALSLISVTDHDDS